MAVELNRYHVWCVDEGAYIPKWAETEPTVCPNDSGHTITVDDIYIDEHRQVFRLVTDPVLEPVVPGASKVLANDRPGIEVSTGTTGFAAIQASWPREALTDATLRVTIQFILKASGTGTKVRIAAKVKSEATGEDSSEAFGDSAFVVVTTTYTTIGEVFEGVIDLDASACQLQDAVALQVGRDGNDEMGTGTSDDVSVAIQLIGILTECF